MIKRVLWALLLGSAGVAVPACGRLIVLPSVFSDHAVFQRGREIPVWGTAGPGERVVVRFAGQTKGAVAGDEGRWIVRLDPVPAGGPYELTAANGLTALKRKDILVGEVWVCSGQSNMAWPLSQARDGRKEVADANYPEIRLLTVPNVLSDEPAGDVDGQWSLCTPQTAAGFSAVGYFFGRELHRRLGVPVGLIDSSWGGSRAEPWTPRGYLEGRPEFAEMLKEYDDQAAAAGGDLAEAMAEYRKARKAYDVAWPRFRKTLDQKDRGTREAWQKPALKTTKWKTMKLPTLWENAGMASFDGVVWFRREVDLPGEWAGKDLVLDLGPIDDDDVTYFNGVKVGATGYGTPGHWQAPRTYRVQGKIVLGRGNVLAVRVLDGGGGGGIWGTPEQMKIVRAGEPAEKGVSLAGPWKYRIGFGEGGEKVPAIPRRPGGLQTPGTMWNGMIAPLVPYGIAGAIWYQGESNAGRAVEYRTLFPTMIESWRRKWGQGDFAFLFVQLANFLAPAARPAEGGWAWVREAQTMALRLPNTGMAVTIDIGEARDIHPRNKQDVGKRLAMAALAGTHGQKLVYSGPVYHSMTVEGGKVRLRFKHVGGGLVAKGPDAPKLKQFAIAGADRKFVWADAAVDGETVVVSSKAIPKPVAVRYAWANNPEGCNLHNKEGLPASPFRTDDWPMQPPAKPK